MNEEASSPNTGKSPLSFLEKIKENGLVVNHGAAADNPSLYTAEIRYSDGTKADVVDDEGNRQPASCQYTAAEGEGQKEVEESLVGGLEKLCSGKELCPSEDAPIAPAENVSILPPLPETPDRIEAKNATPHLSQIDVAALFGNSTQPKAEEVTQEKAVPVEVAKKDLTPVEFKEKQDTAVKTDVSQTVVKVSETATVKQEDSGKLPRSAMSMFTYIAFALMVLANIFLFLVVVIDLGVRTSTGLAILAGVAGTFLILSILILAVLGVLSLAGKFEKPNNKK